MSVAVCIPFRPADDHRIENLERTRAEWESLGWPVVTADSSGARFQRAVAVNAAAEKTDAETLLIADCDILLESPEQAVEAVRLAEEGNCYAIAFSVLWILTMDATRDVRAGARPTPRMAKESVARTWTGCTAVPAALFWAVGGYDERFVGWGAEDTAFLVACSTFGGEKKRVEGAAYHLDHEANPDREDFAANRALADRFLAVDGDAAGVRALIAERYA